MENTFKIVSDEIMIEPTNMNSGYIETITIPSAHVGRIEKSPNDNVNHPAHYTRGNIEVIDIIEQYNLNFHLGNATKYILRAGHKDSSKYKEDLRKAMWYIQREIDNNA